MGMTEGWERRRRSDPVILSEAKRLPRASTQGDLGPEEPEIPHNVRDANQATHLVLPILPVFPVFPVFPVLHVLFGMDDTLVIG